MSAAPQADQREWYGEGPPNRRRSILVVTASLVVLAVAAFVVVRLVNGDDGPRANPNAATLSLPDTVTAAAGSGKGAAITYTRATDAGSARLLKEFVSGAQSAAGSPVPSAAKAAIYLRTGSSTPALLMIGGSAHDDGQLNSLLSKGRPAQLVDKLLVQDGVTGAHGYPTAPLDGAMQCGQTVQSSERITVCAWAGASTLGVLVGLSATMTPAELAPLAQAIRVASEH